MPISYRIDSGRGLILTDASDTLTVDELIAHKAALLADERFRPGFKELSDVRSVKSLRLGPDEMRRLAAFDAQHKAELGAYRLALVAAEDFVFGMARMYQQLTTDDLPVVGVFRSMKEAAAWLGVESEPDATRSPRSVERWWR